MISNLIMSVAVGLSGFTAAHPFRRQSANGTTSAVMMSLADISDYCGQTIDQLSCYGNLLCDWDDTLDVCSGSGDHIARINDAVCYGVAASACTDQRCTVVEGEDCEGSSAYAQVQQEADGSLDVVLENIIMPFDNGTWVNPDSYCGYTFVTSSSCSTSSICQWDTVDGYCEEDDTALDAIHTSVCAPYAAADCVTDLRCTDEDTGCLGNSDFIVSTAH
eukprot:CFRG7274T1